MRNFHTPGRSAVFACNGMCATSHPLAAQVAVKIMSDGGNAMDAAIAGAVLLGFCEPQMTGIGGDLFALVQKDPASKVVAINGSGRAPQGLDAAKLRDAGHTAVPLGSADAVTIPGAVDAFCEMSANYGKMGLDQALAPAIQYAEAGVPVAPRVAFDWAENAGTLQGVARDHYLKNGKPLGEGDMFHAPKQGEVLRAIATQGRKGFYEGPIAADMVNSLQKLGGSHSLDDFAKHQTTSGPAISGTYQGVEMIEHPPNGQGATALLMLNMMKHFEFAAMDPLGATRVHIEAEIAKLAYDARNRFMADPDATARLDHMLCEDTARQLAALINPKKAMQSATQLSEAVHKDTVYITVVDRDRMAVSLIYSIFHGFGSGIASDTYGILMQNRGAGFSLVDGHPNELKGGKRPMHTIIPGMLAKDGRVKMPFGVMGGAYQPNGHARFLSNMVDFGMDSQAAIDAPRSFSDAGVLKLEQGYSDQVRQELADMGHKVEIPHGPIGGAQSILIREDGILKGASDPRKDGCAIGY